MVGQVVLTGDEAALMSKVQRCNGHKPVVMVTHLRPLTRLRKLTASDLDYMHSMRQTELEVAVCYLHAQGNVANVAVWP
jgi:hypothetical protein